MRCRVVYSRFCEEFGLSLSEVFDNAADVGLKVRVCQLFVVKYRNRGLLRYVQFVGVFEVGRKVTAEVCISFELQ